MIEQECQCGQKYKVPDSAVGRRARCKKCGETFTVSAPLSLDDADSDDLFLMEDIGSALERSESSSTPAEDTFNIAPLAVTSDEFVADPLRQGHRAAFVEESGGARNYFGDLGKTFFFATSLGNLVSFCFLWGFLSLGQIVLPWGGVLGILGSWIILGWYAAFRFNLISNSAAGEEDLPSITMDDGMWADIIAPLLKWVGSWLIVTLPAFFYGFFVGGSNVLATAGNSGGLAGGAGLSGSDLAVFMSLLGLGLFCWPMVILCVCLGGFGSLIHVNLIGTTIIRTFPVYLLTLVIVFGSAAVSALFADGSSSVFSGNLVGIVIGIGVALYVEIVALRAIGLYYHHYKDRFTWSWG
jgi:hypothetical protein